MARYKLTPDGVRWGKRFIPNDESNLDWREYQAWIDEGNTPDAADPPPTPPSRAFPDQAGPLGQLVAKLKELGVLE